MDPIHERRKKFISIGITGLFFILVFFYLFLYRAPSQFPKETTFHIEKNSSLTAIAKKLKDEHFIRSETLFKIAAVILNRMNKVMNGNFFTELRSVSIIQGDYYFEIPRSTGIIAWRLLKGQYETVPIKITFPEGSTVKDISGIIVSKIPSFDSKQFIELAEDKEGYLFPDTYFFHENETPEQVIDAMTSNFENKIKLIEGNIINFKKPLEDVVIMASILEEEANTAQSRRIVSGILWRRIEAGIPLQVDSTLSYVNGKTSAELSLKDLSMNSPYNTYKYPGLPQKPITNPGLDALLAAVSPTETDYYYFLSDSKGNIYYATTLAEHAQNRKKYLNR